ncbi:hypothetical protein AMJ57_03455 [Parcubacteria bacterium SG8_24]|nr:MAG: hypothetical protein AMJ57_03455 [Parcubacteria bacterium SG8_24]
MRLNKMTQLRKLEGRRVLVRVDFNVPLGPKGEVDQGAGLKIKAALPTIRFLSTRGARVILVSHLGRPERWQRRLSLAPVAAYLETRLKVPFRFVKESIVDDEKVDRRLAKMKDGEVTLLENIRFYKGEEKNDPFFVRRLASFAEIFVNDAFATAHRAHASNAGVAELLPSYAGKLLDKEVSSLNRVLQEPRRPFVVLMGGAKLTTKLPTMQRLLKVADSILVGGGMANGFFRAKGLSIGRSAVSPVDVRLAKPLVSKRKIVLPTDVLVADELSNEAKVRVTSPDDIRDDEYVVDVGTQTVRQFADILKGAQTIVWNGPVGMFEVRKFSHGSIILGRVIASRSSGKAFGVVGGGDTIPCLEQTGMAEYVDHVSTGGGAMLEFLAGKELPGITPLVRD